MPIRPLAALLAASLAGLALAADPPKPDWSAYAPAATLVGEIKAVKDDTFTLVVTTRVPVPGRQIRFREKVDEYTLTFAEAGLVRWEKLPPKLNDAGKKVSYTSKELTDLKKPTGVPGYAADRTALQDGTIARVTLVRPKSVKPDVAVVQDYRVKYVVILSGGNPTPPDKQAQKKDAKKDDKKDAAKKDEKKARKDKDER